MNSDIINAINTVIKSIPGVPTLAEENSSYKPELLTPWVRSTVLPAEPSQVFNGLNRTLRFSGLIQIDYFAPANTDADIEMIDNIVDYFNHKDNRFLTLDTQELTFLAAWRGVGVPDTDWFRVPVYVRYETFSS